MIFGSRKPEFYALNDLLTISRFSRPLFLAEKRETQKKREREILVLVATHSLTVSPLVPLILRTLFALQQ